MTGFRPAPAMLMAVLFAACDGAPADPELPAAARSAVSPSLLEYDFAPPVFDIAAAPDGSILVAQNTTIHEIRRDRTTAIITVPTVPGSAINGLAVVGKGNLFAASAGLDLAAGAGLWRVSRGRARLVGDIEAFETAHDPDATAASAWKDLRCEVAQGFSAGPQSNPYHVALLTGGAALVADAAGNTLLRVAAGGAIDWVALFTPPVDESGDFRVLETLPDDTDCYVQPVPTAVAIGPDGAYYVGELTGFPAAPGWSRIWRIDADARHATCPSTACVEVIADLTSVIDLAFGPDGHLYVVEYDEAGWLAALGGAGVGGAIRRCDVTTGECSIVESGIPLPGAITFDKRGTLWVVENNIVAPKVRRVALP